MHPPTYTTDTPVEGRGGRQFPYESLPQEQPQTASLIMNHNSSAAAIQPHATYRSTKRVYDLYHARQSIGLGGTMIVAGVLCFIFNIVSINEYNHMSVIGYGIWSGIMFIITGSFGIAAAKKKTQCKIIAFMVLCIISSVLCLILGFFSVFSAAHASYGYCWQNHRTYVDNKWINNPSLCNKILVSESLIACMAFIVAVCTIWGSVLCCKAACCGAGQVLLPVQYIPMQGNQQIMFYPVQQGGLQQFSFPGSNPEVLIGGEMPSASGGSYNMAGSYPYNPQMFAQGPPIYNEHKVPL